VVKLSILDKSFMKTATGAQPCPDDPETKIPAPSAPRTSVYGHAIFNLKKLLPIRNASAQMEAIVEKRVSPHLAEIFSDSIQVSLCYEVLAGKLTLGIIQAELINPGVLTDQDGDLLPSSTYHTFTS
jgi:hypothetical protein